MVSLDEFSRVVSEIHASSVCPENWSVALADIRRLLSANGCAIVAGRGMGRSVLHAVLPDEARECYSEYFYTLDYVLDAVESGPFGVVRAGRELVALETNSEFEADFMCPFEMDDGVFVRMAAGGASASFLAVVPKRDQPFDTVERVSVAGVLARHIDQALNVAAHFAELHHAAGQFDTIIDVIQHGVVVVGRSGRIIRMNAAAERILTGGDGLVIRGGVIEAVFATTNAQLQRALADAGHGDAVACRRISGKRPYVVQVVPLAETAGALVMLCDPESEHEPPQAFLKRAFGMTTAESEVARRVMRGAQLHQIADELVVSKATVRTHLQHIFEKTGTHRQAELVRLLLAVSASVAR